MADPLRLAFVGCGAIAEWHLHAILAGDTRIDVTAAIDPDPRARAEADGDADGRRGRSARSPTPLAAGGFDAVDVMVPHHLHEPVALAALSPRACTSCSRSRWHRRSTRATASSPRRRPRGTTSSWWPRTRSTGPRSCSRSSSSTTARSARSSPPQACSFVPPLDEFFGGEDAVALRRDGGRRWRRDRRGLALDPAAAHVARRDPGGRRRARSDPYPGMEGESLCRALCRFDGGHGRGLRRAARARPARPRAAVPHHRDQGRADDRGHRPGEALRRHRTARAPSSGQGNYLQSYEGELADFAAAVLDGAPLAAGPEQSLGELRAALAMYRSARPTAGSRCGRERAACASTSRAPRVLVTGGTSGIGLGIAARLRRARAPTSRSPARGRAAAEYDTDLAAFRYRPCRLTDAGDDRSRVAAALDAPRRAREQRRGRTSRAAATSGSPTVFEDVGRGQPHRRVPARARVPRGAARASALDGGASVVNLASMSSYFGVAIVPGLRRREDRRRRSSRGPWR